MQNAVWFVTIILMASAAGIFVWVATTAEIGVEDYAPVVASLY